MSNELSTINAPRSAVDLKEQVRLIHEVMSEVMKEGHHYGKIPGCGPKPTLLKPGAQKLCLTFRLVPKYEVETVELEKGHREYRVKCSLIHQPTGSFAGEGQGSCNTMEKRYRNQIPADVYNTCLKIACKRAHVDATISATAASDIFTQDIEDLRGDAQKEAPRQVPPPSEIHELDGILTNIGKKGDYTTAVVKGISFGTKWGSEITNAGEGANVRVRLEKKTYPNGEVRFFLMKLEVLSAPPTQSEIDKQYQDIKDGYEPGDEPNA